MSPVRVIVAITAALVVAGAVLLAVGSGTAEMTAGLACLVFAGIAGVEAAFFAVGRGEDRERALERERARPAEPDCDEGRMRLPRRRLRR